MDTWPVGQGATMMKNDWGGRLRAGILVLAKLLTHKISVRPFLPYLNTIKWMHVRDVFWAQQIKDAPRQLKKG